MLVLALILNGVIREGGEDTSYLYLDMGPSKNKLTYKTRKYNVHQSLISFVVSLPLSLVPCSGLKVT